MHINMGDKGSVIRKSGLLFCARLFRIPVLLHLHAVELDRHYAESPKFLRWLLRQPFRAATGVIVLGERFRDWLVRDLQVPSGKIDILINGVDAPAQPPYRDFGCGGRQTILFLGNLLERKGVSDFLQALALLPRDGPDWQARIAGGGDVAHYESKARDLGLAGKVHFAGWVDRLEVRALLCASDMLVLPSYDEGLPLVILEALGCGLPVLCTPVGAIPETLTDGENVIFCPVGDPAGLSAKIDALLKDRDVQAELSRKGLDLFRRLFSLTAFRDNLFAIYRRRAGLVLPEPTEGRKEAAEICA